MLRLALSGIRIGWCSTWMPGPAGLAGCIDVALALRGGSDLWGSESWFSRAAVSALR